MSATGCLDLSLMDDLQMSHRLYCHQSVFLLASRSSLLKGQETVHSGSATGMQGSEGGNYRECLLGRNNVQASRSPPTFHMNVLPPSSELKE